MAHYAKVLDGKVINVIVAEPQFFTKFVDTEPGDWIQTSYNTYGGVHAIGGTPLRKNFAGVGFTYNKELDAFIPPKPFSSWTLNEDTCLWEAPIAKPTNDKAYDWNESAQEWVEKP